MIINISDDMIELNQAGLLKKLLVDKTTKGHILWGTDAYRERGPAFEREREIDRALLLYENTGLIKTRARKAFEQQSERTKQHGEVFTPRWICDAMIDHLDEEWFGVKEIDFLSSMDDLFAKKKWEKYVDSRRLEITCGEGPFLVQRYDVSTGNMIPVPERKGILDRKLQAVSRYAETEEEWKTWAKRAFQAVYGYEFQGDNLLISRVNFMMTYRDFYKNRWQKEPELSEWEKIGNIITWNLWQMDGLTGEIPYSRMDPLGPSLFELADPDFKEEDLHPACRIYDWRDEKKSVVFNEIGKRDRGMKFDYIIGNPPYQEETEHSSDVNGQRARKNIFQKFQMAADNVTKISNSLIYPGGRWIHQSGKGMKEFGLHQINDVHLDKVFFYADANDVFPGVQIADGISIVLKKMTKTSKGFTYVYIRDGKEKSVHLDNPGTDLIPLDPTDMILAEKFSTFVKSNSLDFLHEHILPRSLFGIESDFVSKNGDKVEPLREDSQIDFSKQIKLFTNDKAGKSGRAKWFIADKDVISNTDYLSEWQVVVSSANAGGQKRDRQLEIIDNHSAFGRARVALRSFKTQKEAENFYKYVESYIIRYAFLLTDEALSSLGKKVPDLLDYTDNNNLIDFTDDIDKQLVKLMGLSQEDMDYIQSRVNNMRRSSK